MLPPRRPPAHGAFSIRRECAFAPATSYIASRALLVERRGRAEAHVQGVFIENFDNGDGRLVAVFGFGVRVHVGQKVAGILLLQLDQTRVEESESLAPLDAREVLNAVAGFVGAAYIEVEIDIDAALVELAIL